MSQLVESSGIFSFSNYWIEKSEASYGPMPPIGLPYGNIPTSQPLSFR